MTGIVSGIRHHAQVLSGYSDSLGQHFEIRCSLLPNGTVRQSLHALSHCRKKKKKVK